MRWVALSMLLCIAGGVYGQIGSSDSVLVARQLTVEEESMFRRDGRPSPFWMRWNADSIDMMAPANCYPDRCGFTGIEDARVAVKAAWSRKGLYLYLCVRDDRWVERTDAEDWGADVLDMYLDSQDARSIFTCTDCLMGLYASTLTYCTQMFQTWIGAPQQPQRFRYAYYDENLWSWQTVELTYDAAEVLYSISMDVAGAGTGARMQEWFIPWSSLGCGIQEGTTLVGKRIAFTAGYNDKDGDNVEPHCLRWRGKDPWATDAQLVNYWGDILLDGTPAPPPPPSGAPVPVAMPDSSTDRTPALAWHPVDGATNYKVVVDDNADFSSPIATAYTRGDTSYTPETLLPYGTIYWKVSSNIDYGLYSLPQSFEVVEVILPPVLNSFPYDSTTDPYPVLSWRHVDGARGYTVWVATDASFAHTLFRQRVDGATRYIVPKPLPAGPVYWRVSSDRDPSLFSTADHFQVIPLRTPAITAPAEMALVSPDDSLAWTSIVDPSTTIGYEISVSLADDFSSGMLCDDMRVDGSVCIADVAPQAPRDRMLFWRVRAVNAVGIESAYTPTASCLVSSSDVALAGRDRLRNDLQVASGVSGETLVRYSVSSAADVRIDIYDVAGSLVKRLVNRSVDAGTYVAPWSGNGHSGCAPAGLYVARMHIGDEVLSRRLRLVK